MSDPLALASILASALSLSGTVLSSSLTIRDTVDLLRARWRSKVKRLEGYELSRSLYVFLSPVTDTLEIMDSNVLRASNETVMDYRARRMAGCSMTGVAAALVAQVTNTSLQQEFTSEIHWIVPAFWTSGLVLSLLSVYYSFLLHHYLSGFSNAADMRHAFTHLRLNGKKEGRALPSLTVAAKLWVPPYLLSLAIGCYVFTLGLYWSLAWKEWWGVGMEAGRGVANRNVFMFYICTTVVAIVLFTVPSAIGKILEDVESLHLYREELGHVCRNGGNIEDGRGVSKTGSEGSLDATGSSPTPNPDSTIPGYSFPIDISAQSVRSGPALRVGVVAAALLTAAEAHRNAGFASQSVAAELERLVDELAEGVRVEV